MGLLKKTSKLKHIENTIKKYNQSFEILLSFIAKTFAFGLLVFLIVIFVLEYRNDGYTIYQLNLPESLKNDGMTNEIATAILNDHLNTIKTFGMHEKSREPDYQNGDSKQFKINVGGLSLDGSMESIVNSFRRWTHKQINTISGAAIDEREQITLSLSVGEDVIKLTQPKEGLSDVKTVNLLLWDAALAIMEKTSPITTAYFYYRTRNYDKCIQLTNKFPKYNSDMLVLSAQAFRRAYKMDQALNFAKSAIEMDSLNAFAQYEMGVDLCELKDFISARKYLSRAIELNPQNASFLLDYANSCIETGDTIQSIKYYEKGLSIDSTNGVGWFNYGFVSALQGNYTKAQALFDRTQYFDFDQNEPFISTSMVIGNIKDPRIKMPYQVIREFNNYKYAYNYYGLQLLNNGNIDSAKHLFILALNIDSNFLYARLNLAASYAASQDLELANANFKRALDLNKNSRNIYLQWGSNLLWQQDYEATAEIANNMLTLNAFDAEALGLLGTCKSALGSTVDAAYCFRLALLFDPNNRKVLLSYSSLLLNGNQNYKAASLSNRVLGNNPYDFDAMENVANCYLATGRTYDALAVYDRMISTFPYSSIGYDYKADLLMQIGRNEESLPLINKSLKINARDFYAHALKGRYYYETYDIEQAIPFFETSINCIDKAAYASKKPDKLQWLNQKYKYALPYLYLGHCYFAEGNYFVAIDYYQNATLFEPQNCNYLYYWKESILRLGRNPNTDIAYGKALVNSRCPNQ